MSHRKFLLCYLMFTFGLVALGAAFDFAVDPYALFGTARTPDFNALKPEIGTRVRMVKPYQVVWVHPHALIVGNSRPELGLDPTLSCWEPRERPVYNMAIPGSSVYMQVRYAQHALSVSPIHLILYGVDFLDFLMDPAHLSDAPYWPEAHQEFEDRLRVTALDKPNKTYWWQSIKDHALALFTLDAFTDSVTTVIGQRYAATTRTPLGFNPATRYYQRIIRTEGQHVLFAQKEEELESTFERRKWVLFPPGQHWSAQFEAVRQLKEEATRRGVRLVLFINPYHADYMDEIYHAGLWPLFEEWKRTLVRLAGSGHPVPLLDFSGYTRYTTEEPPPQGDTSDELQWFWEPAHYRRRLGALILSRVLNRPCSEVRIAPRSFGVSLTSANIESHLSQIRRQRRAYLSRNRSRNRVSPVQRRAEGITGNAGGFQNADRVSARSIEWRSSSAAVSQ